MNFKKCFKDKVVLVTGSSKGIGRDIILNFAKLGAKVAINHFDELNTNANEVFNIIKKITNNVILIKANVSNSKELDIMIAKIQKELGDISILVNNAGIANFSPFLNILESDFNKIISVDLVGPFLCSQKVAKIMAKNNYGKIINISSTFGQLAQLNLSPYCIAKSGVNMLTKSLAYELGKYNININCIGPSTIITDQNRKFTGREDVQAVEKKAHPLGRMGNTMDIVYLTLFLASDYASWITGQTILVDGGLSCRTPQEPYPDN